MLQAAVPVTIGNPNLKAEAFLLHGPWNWEDNGRDTFG
jgi:hypothetical protein